MAEYSRVKKYENLRKEIETENAGKYDVSDTLRRYNKKIESEEVYEPVHEKIFKQEEKTVNEDTESFKNEYLDSFIQEVRSYNMQKGIRDYEDTKIDILQQLSNKSGERRSRVVEHNEEIVSPIQNDDYQEERDANTMEISKHVFELLSEVENEKAVEENEVVEEMETSQMSELDKRIASLEKSEKEFKMEEEVVQEVIETQEEEEYSISDLTKQELLEETRKLKVQIDEYKEELNDINDDVDANNRLLNIIIAILVIALLSVIGVVVYWLISGGIL